MTNIDPRLAASTLTDIERVQRRTRENIHYAEASSSYFVWGGLTLFGYLWSFFTDRMADEIVWNTIMALGVLSSFGLELSGRRRRRRATKNEADLGPIRLQIVLLVFGFMWAYLLTKGQLAHQEAATYFQTLFMFAITILGFRHGLFFTISGLLVAAYSFGVFLWSGPWFDLFMAASSVFLIAIGVWFRRKGVSE